MSLELKIKSKHLAEEAKIIRFEERKLKGQIKWHSKRQSLDPKLVDQYQSIHNHRTFDVRNENRATYLARAYLAGIPYHKVEQKCNDLVVRKCYIVPRVFEMVNKYGPEKDRIVKKSRYNSNGFYLGYMYDPKEEQFAKQKILDWMDGITPAHVNKSLGNRILEVMGF